ncbi:50S ribosomal protein L24 [Aquisalimonas asiatica]|uniref:Large ribosomal subunit protein uL24 n=1 Tax=Aquisalimonas asiatica TaxID=406100 RepID=A0A1H8USZ5_9GAMM|nr:50S ribosomal protein L24 [Aquisalimonas asiatica]SEP06034.1 LSU ribosomal protein L24P [Aquisalimonas asiatica]
MQKIKKGDDVIVVAGKDKGRRGTVVRVLRDENQVVVENVNMVKRHIKANPQRGESGGIQEKEAPVDLSNVQIYNHKAGKGDRVGIKVMEDGRKARYFKSNNEPVDA